MDMDDEEAETEDMSGEGTYTIKVKGKDMDSQNELARIASLSGVAAPQEMETEAMQATSKLMSQTNSIAI